MSVFDLLSGHEQVVFCEDERSGLRAIIAIHSTVLGPALGGTRFRAYPSDEAALSDVLRLARAMTYKAAVAGLDQGGGKAVVIGDPATARTDELLRAHARFIHSLSGRYITAEDVGTTQADMDLIRSETPYVGGTSEALGGSGDPSPATAYGVLMAMRAVAQRLWGSEGIKDRHVVVSGVGKVGSAVVGHLLDEGARVSVADVRPEVIALLGSAVAVLEPDKAHAVECDIFSPNALGGVLTEQTVKELSCAAVVGAANNQLAEPSVARLLDEAGVLFVPDFVVSAGGIINIAEEAAGYDRVRARRSVERIFDTTLKVIDTADERGTTTTAAAEQIAEERITAVASAGARIRTFPREG